MDIEQIKNDAILEGLKKHININSEYIRNLVSDIKGRIDNVDSVVKIFNSIRECVDRSEELYKEYSKHKTLQKDSVI